MRHVKPSELLATLQHKAFAYVATVSFEERACAWASMFAKHGVFPEVVRLFEYDTHAEPAADDERMRVNCRNRYKGLFDCKTVLPAPDPLNAFAFNGLFHATMATLQECRGMPIVFDITCMPRVHIMALASVLVRMSLQDAEWYVTYATGGSYGFERGVFLGWRDVIIVPIGRLQSFRREGHARGIIMAGHYGDRLSVALQEWEPETGVMLYTDEPRRPDLLCKAREANAGIERRLSQCQLVREGKPREKAWNIATVHFDRFAELRHLVDAVSNAAMADSGPVVVFPFGPKPFALQTALSLSRRSDGVAMAVYPVPARFDAGYSKGVGHMYSFTSVQQ